MLSRPTESRAASTAFATRLIAGGIFIPFAAGKFLNLAETELTVIDPQLGSKKLAMNQAAPGRYVADFDTPRSGAYHLEIAQKHQGKLLYQQSRGLMVGYADELRLRPTNTELLEGIAKIVTGLREQVVRDRERDRLARSALRF